MADFENSNLPVSEKWLENGLREADISRKATVYPVGRLAIVNVLCSAHRPASGS